MRLAPLVLLASLQLLCVSASADAQRQGYFHAESFSFSEPVPIRGYFSDWHSPFNGGERALTHNTVEGAISQGPCELGLVARYDYEMRFTRDTADLYYHIENRLPLDPGRHYAIDLEAEHFSATGLRLGYRLTPHPDFNIGLGLTYLNGHQLIDGSLSGGATALSVNDYDFNLGVDYRYSEDRLFKRNVSAPSGQGYSVDLQLDWHPGDWRTHLHITDLLARLYWNHAPFTTATATSDTKSFDSNGYVVILPTLSGVEGNHRFVQKLPLRALLDAQYSLGVNFSALGQIYYTRLKTFVQAGAGYRLMSGQIQALFNPDTHATTLGFATSAWGISVTSDRFQPHAAHTLGLDLALHIPF